MIAFAMGRGADCHHLHPLSDYKIGFTMKKATPIPLPVRDDRINIRVEKKLRDALLELARKDGRSLSSYVERILVRHVEGDQTARRRP